MAENKNKAKKVKQAPVEKVEETVKAVEETIVEEVIPVEEPVVEEPAVEEPQVEEKVVVAEEKTEDKPLKEEKTTDNIKKTNNNGPKSYRHYYTYVWNGMCYD